MPWSDFPVEGQVTHVQWHAFQIVSAMRERQTVTGRWLTALPVDKVTNIQDPQYWAGLQAEVDTLSLLFLDSAGYPTGFDGMEYESPFTLPNYTQATFRSGASLHANGWLRRYKDGASVVSGYGTMIADDIIGTHTFNELYQGINVLVWQKFGMKWASDADLWKGSVGVYSTWPLATAALASDWSAISNNPGTPETYYDGRYNDITDYSAFAQRPHGQLENGENVSAAFRRDADYYMVSEALSGGSGQTFDGFDITFSALGDGVQEGKYSKVLTDSPTADTVIFQSGGSFGSADLPAEPTTPVPPCDANVHGYTNFGGIIVIRWNVTDGFAFVA